MYPYLKNADLFGRQKKNSCNFFLSIINSYKNRIMEHSCAMVAMS